ncbi:MAG: hypothetical protein AB9882_15495 [Ignavibacteriaceae bacterium]
MKNIFSLLRRLSSDVGGVGGLSLLLLSLACNEPAPEKKTANESPAADTQVNLVSFCYIVKVDSLVTVDFIEFFTGNDADKAFKNDNPALSGDDNSSFYIRNNENSLTAFHLSDTTLIMMQTFSNDEEGNYRFNEKISSGQLKNIFKGTKYKHYKNIPFKITIVNSVITKIEEQYIP